MEKYKTNIHCRFIECQGKEFFLFSTDRYSCNETFVPGIFQKTMYALQGSEVSSHDFILRTNLSTFVVFPHILSFISTLPRDVPLYTGFPFEWGIQGTSIFLNQASRQIFLAEGLKEENFESGKPDDVVIGEIMKQRSVLMRRSTPTPVLYQWDYTISDEENVDHVKAHRYPLIRIKEDNLDNYRKSASFLVQTFYA